MSAISWKGSRAAIGPLLMLLVTACGSGELPRAQAQTADRTRAQEADRLQTDLHGLGEASAVPDTATAAQLSGAFRAAADRALRAVVRIEAEREVVVARRGERQEPFPFFFPFPEGGQEQIPLPGTGSGFIFDPNGYILTNNHVVQNASRVRVRLVDGREYDAQVVGGDPNTDVAVIRVELRGEERLPTAQVGDSDALRVGDWVLALGSPLGLDFTVTAGIVSAQGRQINILEGQERLEAFIQTDAAINPGNSGGPLVNLLGQVVGVNTAIQSPTGRNAGYGFAVPISLARKVASDIVEHGAVRRPRLGVGITDVSEADAEVLGLPEISGALVSAVDPNLPAASAGIQYGDVVVAVEGRRVRNVADLQTIIATRQPGEHVTISLIREGRNLDIPVELGMFETAAVREAEAPTQPTAESLLGFQAQPLNREQAARAGLGDRQQGVRIGSVSPWLNNATRIGEGAILLRLNGEPVSSPQDVERIASRLSPGDVVSLIIFADGAETMVNYRSRR